jgi:hypothetical protein
MKVSDLKFDEELLRLRPVNPIFVSRYRQNARAGAEFPPLIVDAKTKTIASGNHRAQMYLAEYGPDHMVKVIAKTYKTRLDLLKDFAKENSAHGNPLDGISSRRLTLKMIEEGAGEQEIAAIFNVPVKKVAKWAGLTVIVGGNPDNGRTERAMPVKRGLPEHVDKMTSKQYDTHIKSDLGVEAKRLIKQVIRWLDDGFITHEDNALVLELQEAVGRYFKRKAG